MLSVHASNLQQKIEPEAKDELVLELEVGLPVEHGHYGRQPVCLHKLLSVGVQTEHHLQRSRTGVHVLVILNTNRNKLFLMG